MKRCALIYFFVIGFLAARSQDIVYSDYKNEDNREINFEILGKQGKQYVIYKNVRWKHMLAFYDDYMHMNKSFRMAYVNDKTFNIDFITYPAYFYAIWQYQKNNTIYCYMVKLDNEGNKISGPQMIDSARIWPRQDQKIYTTAFSENKQHILIYKTQPFNNRISIMTKVFDKDMLMKDSTRQVYAYDERYDVYSDLVIDNQGSILMGKGKLPNRRGNINAIQLMQKKLNDTVIKVVDVPLENKFIDAFRFKVDNLNNQCIINSFYYKKQNDNITGLFSAIVNSDGVVKKTFFYEFPDSLRMKFTKGSDSRTAFNNLLIRNIVVTKDGGFLLAAESSYSVSSNNSAWRRNDYYLPSVYSPYDYNLMSGNYNRYYRPYNSTNFYSSNSYYYDDILLLNIAPDLNQKWNQVIPKKQVDEGDDNFMSFAMVNSGGELQFLFLEKEKNLQLVSHQAITPAGEIKRYATLKSHEAGYEFMPKLSKQVSASKIIIPCLYRGFISFALVDLAKA